MRPEAIWTDLKHSLESLPATDGKLLIRRDGYRIYGIISAFEKVQDPSGVWIRWVLGKKLGSDEEFRECLHRKDPKTGKIEPVVIEENEHLIITARRTPDPRDDDDNFMFWDGSPNEREIRRIRQESEVKDKVIGSLQKELSSQDKLISHYEGYAGAMASEARRLKEENKFLRLKNQELEEQVEHFKILAHEREVETRKTEARLKKRIQKARTHGEVSVMDEFELTARGVKRMKELRKEYAALFPAATEEIERLKLERDKAHREVEELKKKLEAMEAKAIEAK